MPADHDRPTWDMYRRMADSPLINPARRLATLWALEQLEKGMGQDWPERYWEAAGHVPEEVNLGGAHVAALGSLLDLALRFCLLAGTPGLAGVYGFVRPLPGHRVRETMIIPVTESGRTEADIWAELYGSEDTWLDWGLNQAGLPTCQQIFGG